MNSILSAPDILFELRRQKAALRKECKASRQHILLTVRQMVNPMPKNASRIQSTSRLVANGIAVYQGVRIALTILKAFRGLFGWHRRRR